jgi:hypothetical protein
MEELQTENAPEEVVQEESVPSEEVEETAEVEATEGEEQEAPKPDGVQKRINKITAEKYAEQRRAEQAEAELKKLRTQAPTLKQEPKLEDFDYDEESYAEAKTQYLVDQKFAEFQETQKIQRQEAEQAEVANAFKQKVDAAGIEDYGQVVSNLNQVAPLPSEILLAIQQDDNGPQIAYYLGSHLDVADRIATSNPMQAALELGKISAKLAGGKQPKKTSNAPPPITPIKGSGKVGKDYGEMSMEEIMSTPP